MNFAGWQQEKAPAVDALAESAADAQARYAFDKVVGGMAWCMTASSVDVDVAFQENATIGQKIKIGEGIERSLQKMKCRIPLQAHQIQGLDYAAIYPVVQWLVKQVYAFQQEIGDAMRRLSVSRFDRDFALPADAELSARRTQMLPTVRRLDSNYAPARRFRAKRGLDPTNAMHAGYVLMEFGTQISALQPGAAGGGGASHGKQEGAAAAEAGAPASNEPGAALEASEATRQLQSALQEMRDASEGGQDEVELRISQSSIGTLVGMGAADIARAASEFAEKSQALLASGELAQVHRMRAEREAIGRQLQQERRRAEADDLRLTAAAAAREVAAGVAAGLEAELAQQGVQRGATAAEEAELRLQAEQAPQGELAALQRLVERSTSLKLQQTDFKKQCKAQLQQLQQQRKAQLDDLAEEGAEGGDSQLAKVRRVERLFEAESSKADQMRRLLGQKGRQIASLQRQIDEIPTRAELMQYERRFRELYQQLASKSEETKRYYDQYNILGEKQGYLTKEASLINSIHDNFLKVKTMQTNLDKVQGKLKDSTNSKEALQQHYSKLVDKERKYSKLVKDFQLECERNEQVS